MRGKKEKKKKIIIIRMCLHQKNAEKGKNRKVKRKSHVRSRDYNEKVM